MVSKLHNVEKFNRNQLTVGHARNIGRPFSNCAGRTGEVGHLAKSVALYPGGQHLMGAEGESLTVDTCKLMTQTCEGI